MKKYTNFLEILDFCLKQLDENSFKIGNNNTINKSEFLKKGT